MDIRLPWGVLLRVIAAFAGLSSGSAVLAADKVLVRETFDDNRRGWLAGDEAKIENGKYRIALLREGTLHTSIPILDGTAGFSIWSSADPDLALFTNEYAPNPGLAWDFIFNNGNQFAYSKYYNNYAWAMHPGDVGASVIPVPTAVWLFGSGLLGLVAQAVQRITACRFG